MLVAVRDFSCEYDGKVIDFRAGLDRVGIDHPLVARGSRFAHYFEPVYENPSAPGQPSGHPAVGDGTSRSRLPTSWLSARADLPS